MFAFDFDSLEGEASKDDQQAKDAQPDVAPVVEPPPAPALPPDEFDALFAEDASAAPASGGKPFNAVVSLGPNCLTAGRIARAGLKVRSFPFDSMQNGCDGFPSVELAARGAKPGLYVVNRCLAADPPFAGYIALENLADVSPCMGKGIGNLAFAPCPSIHLHDDPKNLFEVAEAYRRRARRLRNLLVEEENATCMPSSWLYRVLFMYTWRISGLPADWIAEQGAALGEEIEQFLSIMKAKWPHCQYLLHVVVVCGRHGPCGPRSGGADDTAAAARTAAAAAVRQLRGLARTGRVAVRFLGDALGSTEGGMAGVRLARATAAMGGAGAARGRARGATARGKVVGGAAKGLDYSEFGRLPPGAENSKDYWRVMMTLSKFFWGPDKAWKELFASYKFDLRPMNETSIFWPPD